jgi:ATP synthase I chain
MAGEEFYAAAERRIEFLTIGLGVAGGVCSGIFWGVRAGSGVVLGAILSWLNFRWMRQGVGALAHLSKAQQGAETPKVPKSIYAKFIGRYALLILAAYVILKYLSLPAVSLLAGFGAVGIAALVEVVSQLFRSTEIPQRNS